MLRLWTDERSARVGHAGQPVAAALGAAGQEGGADADADAGSAGVSVSPSGAEGAPVDEDVLVEDVLVEDVSIDGMCGVY